VTVQLLTVDEAAELVVLSPYTVRAAIRASELRASKLRGRWRIHPDDLADWVAAGRNAPALHAVDRHTPQPRAIARRPPAGGYRRAARTRKDAA
jgi:excisionase family DNA binding protein